MAGYIKPQSLWLSLNPMHNYGVHSKPGGGGTGAWLGKRDWDRETPPIEKRATRDLSSGSRGHRGLGRVKEHCPIQRDVWLPKWQTYLGGNQWSMMPSPPILPTNSTLLSLLSRWKVYHKFYSCLWSDGAQFTFQPNPTLWEKVNVKKKSENVKRTSSAIKCLIINSHKSSHL